MYIYIISYSTFIKKKDLHAAERHHGHSKNDQTGSLLSHVVYLTVLNSLAIDMELRMWQKCHALAAGAGKRTNKESVKEAISDA